MALGHPQPFIPRFLRPSTMWYRCRNTDSPFSLVSPPKEGLSKEMSMSEIDHPQIPRRQMLRAFGAIGAGFAMGPLVALGAPNDRRDDLAKSRAVQNGSAGRFTILHTADIHAQLHTHNEFFFENQG